MKFSAITVRHSNMFACLEIVQYEAQFGRVEFDCNTIPCAVSMARATSNLPFPSNLVGLEKLSPLRNYCVTICEAIHFCKCALILS